ncbi:MAG TPA: ribonuclease E/G [Clostridia bacterium]|nr:ribonuclease E/G [Clostridia bacterium]
MERMLLINESKEGTKTVLVENGRPVEYYIDSSEEIREDSIVTGRVMEHAPALDAYFIDIGNEKKAYLPEKNTYGRKIKQNSIMPLQVIHGERGKKGMHLSCRLLVHGKYCICGNTGNDMSVSSKITDPGNRARLKAILETFSRPDREIIIRTIAKDVETEVIEEDIRNCLFKLEEINNHSAKPGEILYEPESAVEAMMKKYNPGTDTVYFNNIDTFNLYFDRFRQGGFHKGIKHYNKDYDMFDFFNVSNRIRDAYSRTVRMKSGAQLVFDYTEAMCVIDVNSARNSSPSSLSDTAIKTNLEAAEEIAIQLRLRNIGGIIIIDFIEMDEKGMAEIDIFFRSCLEEDPRRLKIGGFTNLGNYEIIRSRKGRRLGIGQY